MIFREYLNEIASIIESDFKLTAKHKSLIKHINDLLNVDITDSIEPRLSERKMITIWTDDLSDIELVNIERIANQYKKFEVQPGGKNKLALIIK